MVPTSPRRDSPTLDLPILPGKPNLAAITKSIIEDRQTPASTRRSGSRKSSTASRSASTAPPPSPAAAATPWHPDNRDSGISAHVATLSTEMIACPWKPSATLLLISVRANGQKDCDVKIAFRPNPENVSRYRLLGFIRRKAAPCGKPAHQTARRILHHPRHRNRTRPNPAATSARSNGPPTTSRAPPISLLHKPDAEPSDDARFAALVCTFAQWLAGEQTGSSTPKSLAALARETASATLPADRADFLKLIEQALQL